MSGLLVTYGNKITYVFLSSSRMKLTLPLTLFIVVMKWRSLLATDPQCINSVCQANMGELGFITIRK